MAVHKSSIPQMNRFFNRRSAFFSRFPNGNPSSKEFLGGFSFSKCFNILRPWCYLHILAKEEIMPDIGWNHFVCFFYRKPRNLSKGKRKMSDLRKIISKRFLISLQSWKMNILSVSSQRSFFLRRVDLCNLDFLSGGEEGEAKT